jgi:hypothetical protein
MERFKTAPVAPCAAVEHPEAIASRKSAWRPFSFLLALSLFLTLSVFSTGCSWVEAGNETEATDDDPCRCRVIADIIVCPCRDGVNPDSLVTE